MTDQSATAEKELYEKIQNSARVALINQDQAWLHLLSEVAFLRDEIRKLKARLDSTEPQRRSPMTDQDASDKLPLYKAALLTYDALRTAHEELLKPGKYWVKVPSAEWINLYHDLSADQQNSCVYPFHRPEIAYRWPNLAENGRVRLFELRLVPEASLKTEALIFREQTPVCRIVFIGPRVR